MSGIKKTKQIGEILHEKSAGDRLSRRKDWKNGFSDSECHLEFLKTAAAGNEKAAVL